MCSLFTPLCSARAWHAQEDAVRQRRQWLEAIWHGEVADEDVSYSREALLSSQAIGIDEVQWAANVVRSRCPTATT
jgi:hypothetical protein